MSDLVDEQRPPALVAARHGRRPFLWRLPPWSRAPWLGLRSPAAVVAVLVTTAILACAVASAPLFLSSSRSAALQGQLAPQCAEAGWPTARVDMRFTPGTDPAQVAGSADALRQAWAAEGRSSQRVLGVFRAIGSGGNPQQGLLVRSPSDAPLTQPANLLWRPGITDHVTAVEASTGSGVWLPASYAETAGAHVGDRITMAGTPVPVTGVYTDLFETDPGPYWCDYRPLYLNLASANTPPPALVLPTDEETAYRLASASGFLTVSEQVPVDRASLSLTDARQRLAELDGALTRAAEEPDLPAPPTNPRFGPPVQRSADPRLADAAQRASLIERGLQGPVLPVAVAGALLALVLVAAAGSFWADRRANEVRLLASRGVGPAPLAGKAALELALPALVGSAVGWAVSRLLIAGLGPADDLDPAATTTAVWAAVAAFVVGLGCAAVVAGLRARGTAERPLGAAPRWPAMVPWELALLAAAAGCWVLLESRDGIVNDHGVAQVNGLLVAFPLLGLAGAAVLLTRLLTRLLPAVRRFAARRSAPVFLAVNRLAAARLATATLLVAVTLPVAVLGYTATLTTSSQATLDAKVGVQVGGGRAVLTVARIDRDAATAAVGTVVDRYNGSVATDAGRVDVQVLAVDPATFARSAFWDGSFADEPLADLVAKLTGDEVGGRLPVLAAGLPEGDPDLQLGAQEVPAQVVATARVLPGRRTADPVVLVAADRLPDIPANAHADRVSELWTDVPRARAVEVATAAGATGPRVVEPDDVFTTANFLGITWTFGYLSALAVFVGVIAVGGLLLYLEARSRTRVSGYVMARRLGLSKAAHLRSLVVELGGVAVAGLVLGAALAAVAVSVVYRRLDVDLVRPPTPLLDVPWLAVAATALTALLVAVLAALYAQRAADRADPASVLRATASARARGAGELAALRDQPAGGVPDPVVLVEPPTGDLARPRLGQAPARRRQRAHQHLQLHGRRPAEQTQRPAGRGQDVGEEDQRERVGLPAVGQPHPAAHQRLPRRPAADPARGRRVQPGLHARAQADLERGAAADRGERVRSQALLGGRDLRRGQRVLRGGGPEGRRRHLGGQARAVRPGQDDGAVGQRPPRRPGRDRERHPAGTGRPQVAGRQRHRMRVRAVQHGRPRRRRQQVPAVEDAAADVPPRVELGDHPAALDPGHGGGAVEGGRRGVGLRHVGQGARVDFMEYTHLGRSGLSVSRLCLGTMNFGWQTPEEDSHTIMDRALQEGINFFDTANVYGFSEGKGRTEEVIGTWFAQGGERRDKTVLATKVYSSMAEWPNETFLSARNIVRACEASLRRLQTDWIDLYQFHHVDLKTPWEEIWQACETLVAQGKVLYVGSSNHAGWQLAAANEAAARRHFQGLVSEQSIYNLLTRHIELEVIPAAQHYGVGIIPWSPLHGGLLAGALEKSSEGSRRYEGRAKQDLEENRAALEEYEALCRELGETPADVGLAWLLHQPGVTAPIVGPRTMEQLDGSLHALAVRLDDDALGRLDEIFPGYKPAPMEYAW